METYGLPLGFSKDQFDFKSLLPLLSRSSSFQNIRPSTTVDQVALFLFLTIGLSYLSHGRLWDQPDPYHHVYFERPQVEQGASHLKSSTSRNIMQTLSGQGYDCVIFWGSQSGTSERYAGLLSRDCLARFGINALVADLSDYDADSIASIQQSHFAIFLLSTYGEGDPSDNTTGFWDWIRRIDHKKLGLENLQYLALGFGNSNYKYYNRVLDVVADALDGAGATALIPRAKADDANGGTEEDFQAWKEDVFKLFSNMGFKERTVEYQPTINIAFTEDAVTQDVFSFNTTPHHQQSTTNSAIMEFDMKSAHELFMDGDRNCIHMELSQSHGNHVVYKTGDHIGIWPCNPEEEVDLLLNVLGLQKQRDQHLTLTPRLCSLKTKFPSPTTPATLFRQHLEICGPVTRKTCAELAQFAPSPEAKEVLLRLGHDRENYRQLTGSMHITLARLLHFASPDTPWKSLPLSFALENLLALQPRYYSISSSSVLAPRQISITALVVNTPLSSAATPTTIPGLTSNYLLSSSRLRPKSEVPGPTYRHSSGPGTPSTKISAHIRRSKFKLPIASSTPLILVGAGTGIAPLRAFLHERAKLFAVGKPVGAMVLFFGCRDENDFLYRGEVEKIAEQLGGRLRIVTAFSRSSGGVGGGGEKKVYVQDRVADHAVDVFDLLDAGANMYICGKAEMAREVDRKLEDALVQSGRVPGQEVKGWFEGLKRRGKWRVDVWG